MILLLGSTIATLAHPEEEDKDIEVRHDRPHYFLCNLQSPYPKLASILQCCECYGLCSGGANLLLFTSGRNYFECLNKCIDYADPNQPLDECRFFTHDSAIAEGSCFLYSNCPELDGSCTTCTSGKFESAVRFKGTDCNSSFSGTAECDPLECNVVGKICEGVNIGYDIVDTQLQCAVNL